MAWLAGTGLLVAHIVAVGAIPCGRPWWLDSSVRLPHKFLASALVVDIPAHILDRNPVAGMGIVVLQDSFDTSANL